MINFAFLLLLLLMTLVFIFRISELNENIEAGRKQEAGPRCYLYLYFKKF